ncbi:alkyl sulfatase C-terminal domain-containing protein [Streptosporangium sp. CA-135522]|uniref:alkyl sulfatase C-terminal domain-containing protein n=1 Tax=Streptosporangium sp. CA-135522 TaxID=3240072 RepID=UPI003D8E01E3
MLRGVAGDGPAHALLERLDLGERADATLTTDAGTLRAVYAGRRSLQEAVRSGDLRLDGDERAAERMIDLLLAAVAPTPV